MIEDSRFGKSLDSVFLHEGGFVNHPDDPGGATNFGITIGTLSDYLGRDATEEEVQSLDPKVAAQIYKRNYWDKVRGDDLPDGVATSMMDFAVNSGPSRATKMLQRVVGVTEDGKLGPITLAAVKEMESSELIKALNAERIKFLKGLKHWDTFGRGWSARLAAVTEQSLKETA